MLKQLKHIGLSTSFDSLWHNICPPPRVSWVLLALFCSQISLNHPAGLTIPQPSQPCTIQTAPVCRARHCRWCPLQTASYAPGRFERCLPRTGHLELNQPFLIEYCGQNLCISFQMTDVFFIALPKTQRDLEDHRPTQHERFLWSSAQVTSNTFKSYPSNFTPCISMYPDSQHMFHSPSCFIPLCFSLNLEPCLVTMHGSNYVPFSAPPPFASIAPVPSTCRWVQWSWCLRYRPHKSASRIDTKLLDHLPVLSWNQEMHGHIWGDHCDLRRMC